MTISGRLVRLLAGVAAAGLGAMLMLHNAPSASATDTKTVHVKAATITAYNGCAGSGGAYFVINQIDTPPASITVSLSDSTSTIAPLDSSPGKTGKYVATLSGGQAVTDATAVVPSDWDGEFVISHCVDGSTTTTTSSTTSSSTTETTPTTSTETTTTETTPTTSTETTTTETTPTTSTETTTTETTPTSSTETTTTTTETTSTSITVSGTSSTLSTSSHSSHTSTPPTSRHSTTAKPVTSTSIQVLPTSSSISGPPSAPAHTGQSWGVLPYLMLAGGIALMLTAVRLRRTHGA